MNIEKLIPYNGRTIQTKKLKELGYNSNDINKLINEKNIVRTRRGYYNVTLKYDVDIKLMKYYLKNNYFEEFEEYFNSLKVKDYNAYYYYFLYSIISNRYTLSYDALLNCSKLNIDERNKFNLYSYALLLNEIMNLPKDKFEKLKINIFKDVSSKDMFLQHLVNKDFNQAFEDLYNIKQENSMDKFEINVLRNLNIKVCNLSSKKDNKELDLYNELFDVFYSNIISNDFDKATYEFNKILFLANKLDIQEERIYIIKDLLQCFNYIISHPNVSLIDYNTDYNYDSMNAKDAFVLSIKRNDYVNSLKIVNVLIHSQRTKEVQIYKILLERIYNFLNIRLIFNGHKRDNPLKDMIKNKKYEDALMVTNQSMNIDKHDKNIITSLLESIVNIDNKNIVNEE